MELFLLRHSDWERLYNCTGVEQQMARLYPMEKRTYPVEAWTIMILCGLYYMLYILCMCSIWKRAENNCYKLLFYIGVIDLSNLWIPGFYQGYLSLNGAFFCTRPTQIYLVGALSDFNWIAESTAGLILAINRCVDTVWQKLAKTLFDGKRVYFWMALSALYALYFASFTTSVVFIPMYYSWFFNPYAGLFPDPDGIYENRLISFHNPIIALGYPLIYAIFLVAFVVKMYKHRGEMKISKHEKMMFVQVLTISCLNTVSAFIYVYTQYVAAPEWLIIVGQYAWFHIHGFPPVIYLLLNKTIRTDCMVLLQRMLLASKLVNPAPGISNVVAVAPQIPMVPMAPMSTYRLRGRDDK